jgi:predicted phosphoribosyltransferase
VIISRKIGAPGNPEFAIGAMAEGGEPYLSEDGLALSEASRTYLDAEIARQRAEIARRQQGRETPHLRESRDGDSRR